MLWGYTEDTLGCRRVRGLEESKSCQALKMGSLG